jgi:CheY-like chemotaxis protein
MVLIADDEEYNRLLLKTILKKWNMPYEEAIDGIDAIEKIKSNHFPAGQCFDILCRYRWH